MAIRPAMLAVLAASAFAAGCVTEGAPAPGDSGTTDESIRQRIAAFETLKPGQEFQDNQNILGIFLKDRAFPLLVEALSSDPSPRIRVNVAICLFLGQDDRAREPLFRAMEHDGNPGVRYQAAYGLCLFRDSRGLPVLFEALRSENPQVRWDANDRLKSLTRLDFAFDSMGTAEAREAAIGRWEGWYREVGAGGASRSLLPPGGSTP